MRAFLVQSNEAGHHEGCAYWDPTRNPLWNYAYEVLQGGHYYFPGWDNPAQHGKQFAKVQKGDLIIHYCTATVAAQPQQITTVYEVVDKGYVPQAECQKSVSMGWCDPAEAAYEAREPRILRLSLYHKLKTPVTKVEVDMAVGNGNLSTAMRHKCSNPGFNICEVSMSDLQFFLNH